MYRRAYNGAFKNNEEAPLNEYLRLWILDFTGNKPTDIAKWRGDHYATVTGTTETPGPGPLPIVGRKFTGSGESIIPVDASAPGANALVTMSAWFRCTGGSGDRSVIRLDRGGAGRAYYIMEIQGSHYAQFQVGGNSGGSFITGTTAYNDSEWHMFTTTYRGGGNPYEIYIDGVLHKSGTSAGAFQGASPNVGIGYNPRTGGNIFVGDLADIRIYYDRCMDESQVLDLYNASTGGYEHELVWNRHIGKSVAAGGGGGFRGIIGGGGLQTGGAYIIGG